MTSRPLVTLAALAAAASIALAACSGSGSTAAPASAAPPASQAAASEAPASAAAEGCSVADGSGTPAEIKGFAFPAGLSVASGQSISWTNGDTAAHTVTFDDGSCSTKVEAGATVTVQYTVPGTHAFHCTIHPSMKGSLEVKG